MIDANHPVRVVNQVIDNLDIDALNKKYKGGGRPMGDLISYGINNYGNNV
jgi:transposase